MRDVDLYYNPLRHDDYDLAVMEELAREDEKNRNSLKNIFDYKPFYSVS